MFLLIARMVLSLVLAGLWFKEPRKCGGNNRMVHYILASTFMSTAWSAWQRASARMVALSHSSGVLPPGSFIYSEIAVIAIEVTLIAVMVYQEYNARTKERYNISARCQVCGYAEDCKRKEVRGGGS